MSVSRQPQKTTPQPTETSAVVLLLGTIVDTTWRMFVPTIGALLIGAWVDSIAGTQPWYMLVGFIFGSLLSTALITRQFKQVKKTNS